MTRWPGLGSITRRTSSSATEKLRVTPVTIASASPIATMQAAKRVAVLVHQALAVAEQIAVALQPLVEIGRIFGIAARQPRIDDLDALRRARCRHSLAVSRTRSSRPTSIAVPRPCSTKAAAARITGSSSPSANTTRFGERRSRS